MSSALVMTTNLEGLLQERDNQHFAEPASSASKLQWRITPCSADESIAQAVPEPIEPRSSGREGMKNDPRGGQRTLGDGSGNMKGYGTQLILRCWAAWAVWACQEWERAEWACQNGKGGMGMPEWQ